MENIDISTHKDSAGNLHICRGDYSTFCGFHAKMDLKAFSLMQWVYNDKACGFCRSEFVKWIMVG